MGGTLSLTSQPAAYRGAQTMARTDKRDARAETLRRKEVRKIKATGQVNR